MHEDENYVAMLEKAYEELPEILKEKPRFKIPEIKVSIQGKQTIIVNLGEVAKEINRSHIALAKYFFTELGTSGEFNEQRAILKGQFKPELIKNKFHAFIKEYVLCKECNRPDTQIIHDKEKRMDFLKCEACGAKHAIREIKFRK